MKYKMSAYDVEFNDEDGIKNMAEEDSLLFAVKLSKYIGKTENPDATFGEILKNNDSGLIIQLAKIGLMSTLNGVGNTLAKKLMEYGDKYKS